MKSLLPLATWHGKVCSKEPDFPPFFPGILPVFSPLFLSSTRSLAENLLSWKLPIISFRWKPLVEQSLTRMDVTRTCQICYIPARASEKYYSHYGAVCCLSCKAFFRRCHREQLVEYLVCEFGGRCDVTLINR